MELRHLRYFIAVAEELHFRRAAERLHMSQPPLSLQISKLEDEVGTKLFERSSQKVSMTAAGRVFLVHAHQVLRQSDTAKLVASLAARGEAGELRVGFTQSVQFVPLFSETLKRFRSLFPGVVLSLREMDSVTQINAIADRHIDLGILPQLSEPVISSVRLSKLIEESLVLATTRDGPFAGRAKIAITDLENEPLICTPRYSGFGLHEHLSQICWARGFVPRVVHESAALASIVVMVATGLGSAVVPRSIEAIRVPGVVYIPFENDEGAIVLSVAAHATHRDSLATNLQDMLMRFA